MVNNEAVTFYHALVRASSPESYVFAPLLDLSKDDIKNLANTFRSKKRLGIGGGWKVKKSWLIRQS
ncbi:hypothetical protein LCGC14_0329720 [marine sediment metagenome]|uniref:Uncharacterized protein n=1 Tax=marine sediment metagenome TaxID=412755 RepID=A0A0F9TMB0_9ZZZZ